MTIGTRFHDNWMADRAFLLLPSQFTMGAFFIGEALAQVRQQGALVAAVASGRLATASRNKT